MYCLSLPLECKLHEGRNFVSQLTTELQGLEQCLTHSRSQATVVGYMKLFCPSVGNRGLEMGQGLTQGHTAP